MKYLTGHSCPRCIERASATGGRVGLITQPRNYGPLTIREWSVWAADNGGYGNRFEYDRWAPWLDRVAAFGATCLFAAVPDRFDPEDVPGNFAATQERWHLYHQEVSDRGLPRAWVAQNGATPDDIPPEAEAVFIGGTTAWKFSERAWAIVAAAKARGLWAHIGRVNGGAKFASGALSLADSADGNVLAKGCDTNWHRVLDWLEDTRPDHPQGRLSLFRN